MTLGEIVDFVLENVGKADAGEPRNLVRQDIIDLFTVDLPAEVGGYLSQGRYELPVGYTGTVQEDGVYTLPVHVRTVTHVLGLLDDASLSTPVKHTRFPDDMVWTDDRDFYYLNKYGPAADDNPYGQPTYILLSGGKVHLRPIPKQGATPLWFGKLILVGSMTQDFSGADDTTPVHADFERLIPCVKAGATVLHALREKRPDVATTWSDIFNKRKSEAKSMMKGWKRNAQIPRQF